MSVVKENQRYKVPGTKNGVELSLDEVGEVDESGEPDEVPLNDSFR